MKTIARDVWLNHQVLAYGLVENEDGSVDVRVYDPNVPRSDDVYIRVRRVKTSEAHANPAGETERNAGDLVLDGVHCEPVNLRIHPMQIRGFFLMPYEPAEPPANL